MVKLPQYFSLFTVLRHTNSKRPCISVRLCISEPLYAAIVSVSSFCLSVTRVYCVKTVPNSELVTVSN